MANEVVFKSRVLKCAKDFSTLYDLISSSNENKEKYKKVTYCIAYIIAALLDKKKQEEVQELCDKLKHEAGEFNTEGDNMLIQQAASSLATKVAMVKHEDYAKFMQMLVEADTKDVTSAILRIAEEQSRPALESEVKIEKVEFADRDTKGATRHDFGSKLYTDVCILKPRVTYQVLQTGESIVLWYKIISPSGVPEISTGDDVRPGFTWKGTIPCDQDGIFTEILAGYGHENCKSFAEAGTWRVEFYNGDTCLYKTTFEIHPLPTTTTSASSTRTTGATSTPKPQPQPKSQPKPQPQPKRSLWSRMNDAVSDLGDWFEDNGEGAAGVVGIIAAVVVGIAVLVGDICIFVNAGIIWGILSLGLAATIGYYGCIIALAAGSIISRVLFFILRVLFYNLYVVLLWVLIPTGIIIYNAVENNSYTPSIVQTTSVQQTTTYYCTAQSGLNVRSTPSKSGKVVGKLKYGQAVEVLQEGSSFTKIKYKTSQGGTAWVGSQYISKTKPATTTTNTTKKTSNTSSKATTTTTSKSKTSSNSTTSTTKATTSNSTSTSKLLVDSKTYLIYKLSSNSGQRIFSVSTSESDYQIISKPSWCTILKKEKGYFEIQYEANPQNLERSGTIQIKAGDATASVVLEQRAGTDNTTSQTTSSSSASTKSTSSSHSTAPTKGMHNGYEYVDLGLSVKWATSNMYGHYRFGEKTPRPTKVGNTDSYRGYTYSLSNDVARANWGGNWRLPTKTEFEELINKCQWKATTQGGVKGLKVTGPSGNSIFLPAEGYRHESTNDLMSRGEVGYYWSSTSYGGGRVWTLNIWCGGSSSNQKMAGAYGSFGNCIRPVCR